MSLYWPSNTVKITRRECLPVNLSSCVGAELKWNRIAQIKWEAEAYVFVVIRETDGPTYRESNCNALDEIVHSHHSSISLFSPNHKTFLFKWGVCNCIPSIFMLFHMCVWLVKHWYIELRRRWASDWMDGTVGITYAKPPARPSKFWVHTGRHFIDYIASPSFGSSSREAHETLLLTSIACSTDRAIVGQGTVAMAVLLNADLFAQVKLPGHTDPSTAMSFSQAVSQSAGWLFS